MFHSSSQHITLSQHIIAPSQSYPCPRCAPGVLEAHELTETFHCNNCSRGYVALRSGRFLYPAASMGWKIAPIFWWDGFRWHWGGTTATTQQLSTIIAVSLLPVIGLLAYNTKFPGNIPANVDANLVGPVLGLLTMQLMYLLCWDFDFFTRNQRLKKQDESVKDAR